MTPPGARRWTRAPGGGGRSMLRAGRPRSQVDQRLAVVAPPRARASSIAIMRLLASTRRLARGSLGSALVLRKLASFIAARRAGSKRRPPPPPPGPPGPPPGPPARAIPPPPGPPGPPPPPGRPPPKPPPRWG